MKLTIRQLRYICEVARRGSVHATSLSLNISQSSILAAISLAEAETGFKIFDRRAARGVVLTPAGEKYVNLARLLFDAEKEFDKAIGDLSARAPTVIRIACFEPFGAMFMPYVLKSYHEKIGEQIEVVLREGNQIEINRWLAEGTVDVAILYDIGSDIIGFITKICKIPAHALVHAKDPLARKDAIWLAEIAERDLVLLDLPQTSTYLLTLFDTLAFRPTVKLRTYSYETVRSAVANGFGASILNIRPIGRAAADSPYIVRKPLLDELPAPTIIITDMYGAVKPLFLRVFIEVFQNFFRRLGPDKFAVAVPEKLHDLLL